MLLLLVAPPAFALSIPDHPEHYVNDYAGLLLPDTRQRLEEALGVFERQTSTQVVVAIFESLEGESLEDFSIRLAEKWKIGSEKNDNGVILLVFKNDRQIRIEVGYGLEGALPDVLADQIIRKEIVPAFKEGDFDGGVTRGVKAILQAAQGEYKTSAASQEKINDLKFLILTAVIFYFLLPFFAYFLILVIGTTFFGIPLGLLAAAILIPLFMALRGMLFRTYFGDTYSRSSGNFWGGGFGGGGFGGGFGGGGGGGFGGGGASGRW